MKKQRVSNVQSYHGLIINELEDRKKHLAQKFSTVKKTTVVNRALVVPTEKQCSDTQHQELHPAERRKVEAHTYLSERAAENVRQWGVRAKIDIEKVKALAASLKTNMKPAARREPRISLPTNPSA